MESAPSFPPKKATLSARKKGSAPTKTVVNQIKTSKTLSWNLASFPFCLPFVNRKPRTVPRINALPPGIRKAGKQIHSPGKKGIMSNGNNVMPPTKAKKTQR